MVRKAKIKLWFKDMILTQEILKNLPQIINLEFKEFQQQGSINNKNQYISVGDI